MGRKSAKKRNSKRSVKKNESHDAMFFRQGQETPTAEERPKDIGSIDKLLDKAEQLIDEFNFELGQKFCQRALEIEPDNVRALEISASLLMELGNTESAKHCLGRAIEVCPESGFSKYMNLGQLMVGATAVQCYQKGIDLMIKEKEAQQAEEVAAACSNERNIEDQDIASGYCAIAEIYLTDCCFEEAAEEKCKEYIEKALECDSDNVEALQLKASFFLSQDNKEAAKEVVKKSVSLWLPNLDVADTEETPEEQFNPVEVCRVPYLARMQCGKLLIEVDEYEMATDVLETLLDEDDEVPDTWYLLGWANYLQGGEYYSNARHYLTKAKEVYAKIKHDDLELLKHVDELLEEIGPPDSTDDPEKSLEDEIASSGEEDMDV